MATTRGPRGRTGKHGAHGERGAVGQRGSRGERGATGQRGATGERGAIGQRGLRGEPGPAGPAGPAGQKASREEIFAAVEEQLVDIRNQLAIQLTRFGQLQAQLDHIEKLLKQLVQTP